MKRRCFELISVSAIVVAVAVLLKMVAVPVSGQTPAAPAKVGPAPTTIWGAPDLQGIWTTVYQIPLQRPAKYANKEFFTDAEVAQLDKERAAQQRFGDRIAPTGTVQDVASAYNSLFNMRKHSGKRTSLVVDPPNGRIPPFTAEAQKRRTAIREFEVALLQATDVCKEKRPECAGGTYGPPSPRRSEPGPFYGASGFRNRADGPEDRGMSERCLSFGLPEFGGNLFGGFFPRIVQSRDAVSIYYDVGQGNGWQRIIPINNSPHLPATVRQWWGDSRGHWEGKTLVVDVANFSPKGRNGGASENLHLIERFTRLDADTLEYVVTMEDPSTWTAPWTVKVEWNRQSEHANRVYYEPRCHEGNYGLVGQLVNTRFLEKEFAEGRGPDPFTICIGSCGNGVTDENRDPLR